MLKHIAALSVVLVMSAGVVQSASADEKPYKEGPVSDVAFIRVKDGKFMEYMAYLNSTWKQENEALKKAGLLTGYEIFQVEPRHPGDANLILVTTFPNYGTLDRVSDYEAVVTKVEGSLKAADKGYGDRDSLREVLGSELMRELQLK